MGVLKSTPDQPANADDNPPFKQVFERYVGQWMTASLEAARGSEAIIYTQLFFIGDSIAEALGIPCLAANHTPITPTRTFPTAYARTERNLGGALNLLTYTIDRQLFWHSHRTMINRLRHTVLNLPPLPLAGPYGRQRRARMPVLYAYSPAVVPRPQDWDDWIYVTGYWFLDRSSGWQPPPDLEAFLADGPPPIYLGLGSVTDNAPDRIMQSLLDGLASTGQRVILLPGKLDLNRTRRPTQTYVIASTAFDWLFPRVAGVICHGGPGTLSYALRAGVPTLSIPFFGDQPFWGRQTYRLGCAAAPVPVEQVNPERIAAAVRELTGNSDVRRRAAALGERIQAEDGVARAVEIVARALPLHHQVTGVAADNERL
jgi:UDP:flavonoid glycosyltransferase YjiC (YdhE family)